jgi:hypothetical protein
VRAILQFNEARFGLGVCRLICFLQAAPPEGTDWGKKEGRIFQNGRTGSSSISLEEARLRTVTVLMCCLIVAIWAHSKLYLKKVGAGVSQTPGGTRAALQCHSGDIPAPRFFRNPLAPKSPQ